MNKAAVLALACALLADGVGAFVPATTALSRVKPAFYRPDTPGQENSNQGFSPGFNNYGLGSQNGNPVTPPPQQNAGPQRSDYSPSSGAGPIFDTTMSDAARSLKIEIDAEMNKDTKDYQRLKDLKAQMDAQTTLDADRMAMMAELKAAEGREDYDRCAQIQQQLESFPKSVAAGAVVGQPRINFNGMSRARRTRGIPYYPPSYGYGMPLGYGYNMGPYPRWRGYGGYNPYTGYNMYNPYNYGMYGSSYGFNRWYDPYYSSYYGVGSYWGGIPWRFGYAGGIGNFGYNGGYPWY